ncbi:hypothetical protein BGZ95_010116 [Linnemannia exigua]|uniref:Uncharacterized protein n=1 Tax=Linnemannia exigua TaxID=604196 RepID=A0AAD4DDX3_9FUNG|nr:hypothetical protein BGZ95_010116 [Linnemannia exigua]
MGSQPQTSSASKKKERPQQESSIDGPVPPKTHDAPTQDRSSRTPRPPRPALLRYRPILSRFENASQELAHQQPDGQQGPGHELVPQHPQQQEAPSRQRRTPRSSRAAPPLDRLSRFTRHTFYSRTHSRSPILVTDVSYAQAREQQPERWNTRRAWEDWIGALYEEALEDPSPEYTLYCQDLYQHQRQQVPTLSNLLKEEELEVIVISDDEDDMVQELGVKSVLTWL